MKIKREDIVVFRPIVLTLESLEEARVLLTAIVIAKHRTGGLSGVSELGTLSGLCNLLIGEGIKEL